LNNDYNYFNNNSSESFTEHAFIKKCKLNFMHIKLNKINDEKKKKKNKFIIKIIITNFDFKVYIYLTINKKIQFNYSSNSILFHLLNIEKIEYNNFS